MNIILDNSLKKLEIIIFYKIKCGCERRIKWDRILFCSKKKVAFCFSYLDHPF